MLERLKSLLSGKDRSNVVKRNMLYSLLIRGFSILVSFALVPLTIGYVSSELYGVWLTLSSVLTWLTFMDIGFTQGLKNRLAEAIALDDYEKGRSLVTTTYVLMLIIFVPFCVLFEILVPHVDWCSLLNVSAQYESDIVRTLHVLVAFAGLQMVVNVLVSVAAAFQKVALSNSFSVIGNVLSLIAVLVLTKVCAPSLLALCFSLAAMPILVTIVASVILFNGEMRCVKPSLSHFRKDLIRDLFSLGYKFFLVNIQVLVVYQSTSLLISHVSSPLDVTSYNLAYKYLNLAMMVFTVITAPLWPAYTDAYVKKDYAWMNATRKRMMKILFLSIACCIVMVAISPLMYRLWVQDKAVIPLQMTLLVALYVIVFCWSNLNGTILVGMGVMNLNVIILSIGMLVHIPLALFLSRFLGAYGVVVSMLLITLAYSIVYHIQVDKLLTQTAHGIWSR